MLEVYTGLTEKEAKKILKENGIKSQEIEQQFKEAKENHRIVSPMFKNLLYCFVLEIKWGKKRKYNIYKKTF